MEYHEVAGIFPMMQPDEYAALRDDIQANGQREPIWTHDGKIIDGRNRHKACTELGIEPSYRTYQGDGALESLVSFVVSLNLKRRHLSSSQLAFVGVGIKDMYERAAKERQRAAGGDRGNQYTGGKVAVVEIFPQPPQGEIPQGEEESQLTVEHQTQEPTSEPTQPKPQKPNTKARDQAAAVVGTNGRYVSDAEKLQEDAPDLAVKVQAGELTIPQAKKEQRKRARANEREQKRTEHEQSTQEKFVITAAQDIVVCRAVITDPPYGILVEQDWEPTELHYFTREWLGPWNDCGADFLVSFWSQRYVFDGRQWFDDVLTNYEFQQLLIWHYPNNKKPQSRRGFKQTWEPIYFYRRKDSERPINLEGGEWGKGLNDFDCHVAAIPQSNFNDAEEKVHPAQKPVSVMKWLVNALTDVGDLVCDPFCGSGTTGIASLQLGRRFHGIETNDEYRIIAAQRIQDYATSLI